MIDRARLASRGSAKLPAAMPHSMDPRQVTTAPDARMNENVNVKEVERLERVLGQTEGRLLVAYSGGVDSTLVLAAAHRVLGGQVLGVTAVSPSLPVAELEEARRLAAAIGARHLELATYEHLDPSYQANRGDRCYHCKSELYARLSALKSKEGFAAIADGTNLDDLSDIRPGLKAAGEHGVFHPLVLAGLDKAAVRRISHELGLPTWDKPEMACLASRLPVGVEVTVARLRRAEQAEAGLRALGFRQVRVRDLGSEDRARIEIGREEMARVGAEVPPDEVVAAALAAGFTRAEIDPRGYRRGGAGDVGAVTAGGGTGESGGASEAGGASHG